MRTDEECLAIRALVSPPHLRRKLPRAALPPMRLELLAPAEQLRRLLTELDSPRPVYCRLGEQALETGNAERLAYAIDQLKAEIAYCRASRQKAAELSPLLYAKSA